MFSETRIFRPQAILLLQQRRLKLPWPSMAVAD